MDQDHKWKSLAQLTLKSRSLHHSLCAKLQKEMEEMLGAWMMQMRWRGVIFEVLRGCYQWLQFI